MPDRMAVLRISQGGAHHAASYFEVLDIFPAVEDGYVEHNQARGVAAARQARHFLTRRAIDLRSL